MKHIFVNLKRFDVPRAMGGVNGIADIRDWGPCVIEGTQDALEKYRGQDVEFAMFFPELHILTAAGALKQDSMIQLGCQGVYGQDVQPGGNFGAFTTDRPAAAMKAAGCGYVIVGHCEERNHIRGVLEEAGCGDTAAQGRILNAEIQAAAARGMKVLYCIGEKSEELERWEEVLGEQLESGLSGVDKSMVNYCLRAHLVHRTGKNTGRKRIYYENRKICKRENRRNGRCVRRWPETGQCGHAGVYPGN